MRRRKLRKKKTVFVLFLIISLFVSVFVGSEKVRCEVEIKKNETYEIDEINEAIRATKKYVKKNYDDCRLTHIKYSEDNGYNSSDEEMMLRVEYEIEKEEKIHVYKNYPCVLKNKNGDWEVVEFKYEK